MAIRNTSPEVRNAIRRKSAESLPNNPSGRGYTADELRKAIYAPMYSGAASLLGEINRVVDEINEDGEAAAAVAQGIRDDLTLAEGRVEELEGAQEQLRQDFDNLDLDDNRPVKTESAGLTVTVSGEVAEAVRAVIKYQAAHALFRTREEAAAYAVLYQAADAALKGGWITASATVSGSLTGYHIDPGKVWVRWYGTLGELLKELKINEGGLMPSAPDAPMRENYEFAGWVATPATVGGKVMYDTEVRPSWTALPVGIVQTSLDLRGDELDGIDTEPELLALIRGRLKARMADGSQADVTEMTADGLESARTDLASDGDTAEITVTSVNGTELSDVMLTLRRTDAAPTAFTLSISATHATVTVTRDGDTITADTAIYAEDVLTIRADAEEGYQNPVLTVNEQSFTSGSTHTVSGDVTISATAAPATYDIEIPTVTGATITVLVNGSAYTSGKLTHGASVKITVAAQNNYNITSSSVTMGGQPVAGSNGEYNISSVTGAVVISATAESERVETTDSGIVSTVTSTRNLECTMANKKFSSVRKIDVQGTTKSTSGWIVYSATFENDNGDFKLTDVLLQNNVTLVASTSLSNKPLTDVAYKEKDGISAPTIDNSGAKTKVILPCMSGIWGTYNATNIDYQTGSAGAYTVTLTGYEA